VSYVIAGYTVALATLFVYGIALGLRRRRWERALRVSADSSQPATPGRPVVPGGRP
jgi:hypothetical protein